MKFKIKNFTREYWDGFVDLINTHWKKNHPITNRKLFDWQYRGFSSSDDKYSSKILIHNNNVVGFRGVIPGLYQVKDNAEFKIIQGAAFAMALISPDYRGSGLGYLKMFNSVHKTYPILVTCGANTNTTVPINLKLGFTYLQRLNRYVIPLDPLGYQKLLSKQVKLDDIQEWFNNTIINDYSFESVNNDVEELEYIWKQSTADLGLFGIFRNKDFWKWRYLDSQGFKYHIFGGIKEGGIIVARIEPVLDENHLSYNNLKVLRIIEAIPYNSDVWEGIEDKQFISLLSKILKWGLLNNCCAADFQCSNIRMSNCFKKVGFKIISNKCDIYDLINIPEVFQPIKFNASPINAMWRIKLHDNIKIQPDDTYIVKSDGDMDRPNN